MTFTVSHNPDGIELRFSATLENIDRVAEETKRFVRRMDVEEHTFDVFLVMREALVNAVIHGSGGDGRKIVSCALRLEDGTLIMEIEDEGEGFDWRGCLAESPDPNSDCGRGLGIMKEYCADVKFNDKGNRLVMRKRLLSRVAHCQEMSALPSIK